MTTNKLQQLVEASGFDTAEDMLLTTIFDGVMPGICMNVDCDYTVDVEPDQTHGWCEACDLNTVKSAGILMGVI